MKVAVVGATGLVGSEILTVLEERNFSGRRTVTCGLCQISRKRNYL